MLTDMRVSVRTGLDLAGADGFTFLRGKKVGLLSHAASVNGSYKTALDVLSEALGESLRILFTPEHGFFGHAQDLEPVRVGNHSGGGPRWVSLYGDDFQSLSPRPEDLGQIDTLVIDLVDIGSRYYTFQASMLYAMVVAFANKVQVIVLDRPNPLSGARVEGPMLEEGAESFVGPYPIPTRHGLTLGELAILYKEELELQGDLEVIPCQGWRRSLYQDETTVPWVLPSPNMPTLQTALVYPGQCLLEGTNLSEGRGTTRPFELFGAPWLDAERVARGLNSLGLAGVSFRPATFKPTFQKHQGTICHGAQIHVTDRHTFQPVRVGLAVLETARNQSGSHFQWRSEPYEFVADRPAVDLLFGSDRERLGLMEGQSWQEISQVWGEEESDFLAQRKAYLIYGD